MFGSQRAGAARKPKGPLQNRKAPACGRRLSSAVTPRAVPRVSAPGPLASFGGHTAPKRLTVGKPRRLAPARRRAGCLSRAGPVQGRGNLAFRPRQPTTGRVLPQRLGKRHGSGENDQNDEESDDCRVQDLSDHGWIFLPCPVRPLGPRPRGGVASVGAILTVALVVRWADYGGWTACPVARGLLALDGTAARLGPLFDGQDFGKRAQPAPQIGADEFVRIREIRLIHKLPPELSTTNSCFFVRIHNC